MKILIDGTIFTTYPHGGIARLYRELLPRIVEQNPKIIFYILCIDGGEQRGPVHERIEYLTFSRLMYRPERVFSRINNVRRVIFNNKVKQIEPDIFHSTYYTDPLFPGIKTVAMVYDLIDYEFPLLMPNGPRFVERQGRILKSADHVVGISKASTDNAINAFGLNRNKTTSIYLDAAKVFHPVHDDIMAKFRTNYTNGKRFFLFVGSVISYKNLGTLIRAFGKILDKLDYWLVLAGHSLGNFEHHFVDLAIENRVEHRISRIVHPDDELLCKAYNAAEAFVFPSLQEGFGIPLIEAMRCETPVIASDIPVFREICGDAAEYFDPHDSEALALKLLVAASKGRRDGLIKLGVEQAKKYSWDDSARILGSVYRALHGS